MTDSWSQGTQLDHSFFGAEYNALPEQVRTEVQTFADVNIAWLAERLVDAGLADQNASAARARARSSPLSRERSFLPEAGADISLFDTMIQSYQEAGMLPGG